ncbi:MAG: 3-isopropylmalate/(R)-2-methylmalate dehydratase large subunit, partial [Bacteroidia bacterium]
LKLCPMIGHNMAPMKGLKKGMAKNLLDKLLDSHTVKTLDEDHRMIYIDRIFLHERTGSIALKSLAANRRVVQRPEQAFCTMDHIVDTHPGRGDKTQMPSGHLFIQATRHSTAQAGIRLFDIGDADQGIAHVVSAEQGIALPGCTMVCPDSHTCTLGGLGALAWGIGSTEAEHALATKTLVLKKARAMRVTFTGSLTPSVSAKDMILHLIAQYGANGGAGFAVEFCGQAVSDLSIEARMTLCNMAVEFSAVTGFVAPDNKTIDYVKGRPFAPTGQQWTDAVAHWQTLHSDPDAHFDSEIVIDAASIEPSVSWGTNPQHSLGISESVPCPNDTADPQVRTAIEKAQRYMELKPGEKITDVRIDAAFIGSCTNSRISDLRAAAALLNGKRIADGVAAVCVPGSSQVKKMAEAEGLHQIFIDAGFEWRESGCSMCFYAGGETFGEGKRVISSTNRNFEGRQGPKVKTHIASPLTVAASALTGRITDPRDFL